jgi:single-stranded-DNA-specific exonuclease
MAFGKWNAAGYDEKAAKKLRRELSLSPLAARVLASRGYSAPELARDFLEGEAELGDPMELKGAREAAERINRAIDEGERIAVFGDYDVDGVTAAALVWSYLQSRGGDAYCSLPQRDSSGYGISREAIDNLKKSDISLIITVDNGVSARDEVEYAGTLGIDVIVCDHHLPPERLPNAVAVVNPLLEGDRSAFKDLAGVGVALKLCAAAEGCGAGELLEIYGYLAAIGTISDIMPLVGENRTIVKAGLEQLRQCDNPGLTALCESAGLDMGAMTSGDIAFGIAPRLNAAGRMDSADVALRLLITDDPEEAAEIAARLDELNQLRRDTEAAITEKIGGIIEREPSLPLKPIVIVAAQSLHHGVAGIVSAKLVERYGKPAIVISVEGGEAKGSGRSIAGFSLHEAITACSGRLIKFGGHDMAAGFTIAADDIEAFKRDIFRYCLALPNGLPLPELRVDAVADFEEIDEEAVAGLDILAPFGCKNEEPVFYTVGAEVADIAPLGERHSRVTLTKDGKKLAGAFFGRTPDEVPLKAGGLADAAYTLSIYNSARGGVVSVRYRDLRVSGVAPAAFDSIKAYNDFCAGRELCEEERRLIAPSRQAVAAVYRGLRASPADPGDYAALCSRFPLLPPGRTAAALDVLRELGLIEIKGIPGGGRVARAAENPRKNDLANSGTYIRLCGALDGVCGTEKSDIGERQTV